MVGDDLRNLQDGMSRLVATLRTDPHALETAYLSVIGFAGKAKTIVPLVEVAAFYPPRLPVGSGTNLGAAMMHLMNELDSQVHRGTAEQKGDWKPIVYLLTDGKPTDNIDAAVERWNRDYAKRVQLVAVGIGKHAALTALRRFTETVLVFENAATDDFKRFIDWISQSVSAQSRSVSGGEAGKVTLAKIDDSILKKIDQIVSGATLDEDFAIIRGTCQKTKLPYLMKFERAANQVHTRDLNIQVDRYLLAGVFAVEKDYEEWSDAEAAESSISSDQLIGAPGCPHCGNPIGFAMCACGSVMCLSGPGTATCPVCHKEGNFGPSEGEGFDVSRARG
jgi:uncharacterized protein YegL